MEKKKLVKMIDALCCSNCHESFNEDSIEIIRQEDNLFVIKIVCQNCQKSFGIAMLGINSIDIKDLSGKTVNYTDDDLQLKIEEEAEPISYDDVLDAHKYIQNLDKNWENFIKEKNL